MYVSANPHTALEAGGAFHNIIELWETDFDEEVDVVRPETVRDALIDAFDTYPNKRVIGHFMQSHGPFIGSDIGDDTRTRRSTGRRTRTISAMYSTMSRTSSTPFRDGP